MKMVLLRYGYGTQLARIEDEEDAGYIIRRIKSNGRKNTHTTKISKKDYRIIKIYEDEENDSKN